MQTLTSRSTTRRRWTRFLGTGATAFVAATTIGSAAGAATTPANAPGCASGSVAALRLEHGGAERQHGPDHRQLDQPRRSSPRRCPSRSSSLATGDCVTVTGTPSKTSKTTIAARSITRARAPRRRGPAPSAGPRAVARRPAVLRRCPAASDSERWHGSIRRHPTQLSRWVGPAIPRTSSSIAIASGKVTAVSGSTVSVSGVDISPGELRHEAHQLQELQELEDQARSSEDPEPQDHDVGLHDAVRDPVDSSRPTWPSVIA